MSDEYQQRAGGWRARRAAGGAEMTDRELDALVAEKVMGWCRRGHYFYDEKGREQSGFSPATDMSAAWQVAQKLSGTRQFVSVVSAVMGPKNYVWGCKINLAKGLKKPGMSGWDQYTAYDKEASRAICLAALKAMGVKV